MHFWPLCALFAGASSKVIEHMESPPRDWSEVASPSPYERITLSIAMAPPDRPLFEATIANISTPGNSRYADYLTRDQLQALLRPNATATEAVLRWLRDSGVPQADVADDGQWIKFTTDVLTADRLLDSSFKLYHRRTTAGRTIRTKHYSLPDDIATYIDTIQPTTHFPGLKTPRESVWCADINQNLAWAAATDRDSCKSITTPSCLKDLYHVPSLNNSANGFIGIAGFIDEYPQYNDLVSFSKQYAPYLTGSNFTFAYVKGNKTSFTGYDHTEANLNVQYAMSMGFPVPVKYYSTDQSNNTSPIDLLTACIDVLAYLLAEPDGSLPHTLSMSYGSYESSVDRSSWPLVRKMCEMFGQLATRGVTTLIASGNHGPGRKCNHGGEQRFDPDLWSTCPYVTSVGGTMSVHPEKAGRDSAGGFSNVFERPVWQNDAVEAYISTRARSSSYNASGRGFPDISARMDRYTIFDNSQECLVEGTSAAAPSVAGIIGQINSALIGAGKQPLGLMNPFLYSKGRQALKDIANGSSYGCREDLYPWDPTASWRSAKGWDPVTGLGTVLADKLLDLAMQQQN